MPDFETDLRAALERRDAVSLPSWRHPGRRPALVVVDMMNAFTRPESPIRCAADEAVEATAQLLAAARAHGLPVVHTRGEYDDAGLQAAAAFLEKVPPLAVLSVGSWWAQIDERVAPIPSELVLVKLFPSAFFGTPLSSYLIAQGCEAVICVGTSTSGCVRATVVDALQHSLRVFVPREGVADRSASAQDAALADIDTKYGSVVSLDDAIGLLSAHRPVEADRTLQKGLVS